MYRILRVSTLICCLSVVATGALADFTNTATMPMYQGPKPGQPTRLDQCWMLGKNCGQQAADKYCVITGFQKATAFQTEKASPTKTLVGQPCTGAVCVAFKSITCATTAKKPGPGEAWPVLID